MLKISVDNFATEIIDKSYNKLVLLDISAEWCAPCKIITPLLDKAADEYDDNAFIGKLEAEDENMKIAGTYKVRGFPTILAFKNGVEVDRFHGAKPYTFIRDFIKKNLNDY